MCIAKGSEQFECIVHSSNSSFGASGALGTASRPRTRVRPRPLSQTRAQAISSRSGGALLECLPIGVLLLDHDGLVTWVNHAGTALFEAAPGSLEGTTVTTLFEATSRKSLEMAIKRVAADGQPESVVAKGASSSLHVELTLARCDGDSNVVCSVREVNQRAEAERQFEAFLSNVTHELRTPITSLKLLEYLLEAQPAKHSEHLRAIKAETDRMVGIIDSLARLTQPEKMPIVNLPTVDLGSVVCCLVADRQSLATSRGIQLNLLKDEDNLPVRGDEAMLRQALSILLDNALTYTPCGGAVRVTLSNFKVEDSQWPGFSVADTGPGIPVEEQSRIFERFFRGSRGMEVSDRGKGLGLAILKQIVTYHEGRIEVKSTDRHGRGATFVVLLPPSR